MTNELNLKNHPVVFMLDEKDRYKLRALARAEGLSDAAYVRQILFAAWEKKSIKDPLQMREDMLERIREGRP